VRDAPSDIFPDSSQEPPSPAEAAEANPQALFAHLRHELRTPINAILGYSEMLLEDTAKGTGLYRDLERIRTAGSEILSKINELLYSS
jgi:signal transduction histidine kinase